MELIGLDQDELRMAISDSLRLPSAIDGVSLVAEVLRKVASYRCPETPAALRNAAKQSLLGLVEADNELIEETLDNLVSCGDLAEVVEERGFSNRRIIYLGAPRLIRRERGGVILTGIRPDGQPLASSSIEDRIELHGHLRRISDADENDIQKLIGSGLVETQDSHWLDAPELIECQVFIEQYVRRLEALNYPSEIEGLQIFDFNKSSAYYNGRKCSPQTDHSGMFVGRRKQRFGSDLWCFVDIANGLATRILDLPINSNERGCDEAWRLQAAIDASEGTPQNLSIRQLGDGTWHLGICSPPPRWLQRRWDLIGTPVKRSHGSLFTWQFARQDVSDEVKFAESRLWFNREIYGKES